MAQAEHLMCEVWTWWCQEDLFGKRPKKTICLHVQRGRYEYEARYDIDIDYYRDNDGNLVEGHAVCRRDHRLRARQAWPSGSQMSGLKIVANGEGGVSTIGFFCEEHQIIHIDGVCPTNWEPPENYKMEQVTLSEAELRAKGLVRWNEVYPGVQRWHGNIWILDPREKPID